MKKYFLLLAAFTFLSLPHAAKKTRIFRMSDYGIKSDTCPLSNVSPLINAALQDIHLKLGKGERALLLFEKGTYHFHPSGSAEREYYISNHDQNNPKRIGICLEDFKNITLDGDSSLFVFHGTMLPISLIRSTNCTLRNFTIDFQTPHIAQVEILSNDPDKGITFRPTQEVKYTITPDSIFTHSGEGWTYRPSFGIAFEKDTHHIMYNTGDIAINLKGCYQSPNGDITAPKWKDSRLSVGTRVAMRTGHRPTPGIFLSENKNTQISDVNVCYAEGMGLLAQVCEDITLLRFKTPISKLNPQRYFTTQADATHFSGCKGRIISTEGLYTGMMDDAINVHGTYLKVIRRINDHTLEAQYMHNQSWGFKWGDKGDEVQFIQARTMEITGSRNHIRNIEAIDKPIGQGVKTFRITFTKIIPKEITDKDSYGIENLTWTPRVIFRNNTISNNRARGALFSTPRRVLVENNTFDHVSGCAILICGDCNGWYETGACRNIAIKKNIFINTLTSMFQFTNAIISIYPEIPDLDNQKQYFHGGHKNSIRIENNTFETFDTPIVYAKSVNGLLIKNNTIKKNQEYPAFHYNQEPYKLEHVINSNIQQ